MTGKPSSTLLALPDGDSMAAFLYDDGGLERLAALDLPTTAFCRSDGKEWIVGGIPCAAEWNEGFRELRAFRLSPGVKVQEVFRLPATKERSISAFTVDGSRIIVGGKESSDGTDRWEMFLSCADLAAEESDWQQAHIAPETSGNSIDDLLVDGDRLIVMDNIVVPKFIVTYRFQMEQLRFEQLYDMPIAGTYMHVERAALGGRVLAVLSSSAGMAGHGQTVTVLNRRNFKEIRSLTFFNVHGDMSDWNKIEDIHVDADGSVYMAMGKGGLCCWMADGRDAALHYRRPRKIETITRIFHGGPHELIVGNSQDFEVLSLFL